MSNMVGVCPGCVGCRTFGPDWHTANPAQQQVPFPPEYYVGMAQYRAPRDVEIERAAREMVRVWDDLASIADMRGSIELLRKALEQK